MPPKEADKLSEEATWWIRDWINEGAPWPSNERITQIEDEYAEGEQVITSKALSKDCKNAAMNPRRSSSGCVLLISTFLSASKFRISLILELILLMCSIALNRNFAYLI